MISRAARAAREEHWSVLRLLGEARSRAQRERPLFSRNALFAVRVVIFMRQVTGTHEHPRAVYFRHGKRACTAALEEFFECPIHFGADVVHMTFPHAWLALPCVTHDAERARVVERRTRAQLEGLPGPNGFLAQLRLSISRELDSREPSLALIAKRIGVSARTLRRRLQDLGTSYSRQLDAVRRFHAILFLLAREPLPVIARRLGFNTRAAFFKAHKRWTGLTPGEAQRRAKQSAGAMHHALQLALARAE